MKCSIHTFTVLYIVTKLHMHTTVFIRNSRLRWIGEQPLDVEVRCEISGLLYDE